MTEFEGDSSSENINLGWDNAYNFTGNIYKDDINNYFLNLNWKAPNTNLSDISIKYYINY